MHKGLVELAKKILLKNRKEIWKDKILSRKSYQIINKVKVQCGMNRIYAARLIR